MIFSWIFLFFMTLQFRAIFCIRNVQLVVPPLIKSGTTATLLCLFDLEDARLYSVKWYRGQHEFFRFVPGDNPPTKVFQILGIYVDMIASNQHQVTLHNVQTFIAGEISCEITTDAPSISTACVSEQLKVEQLDIDLSVDAQELCPDDRLIAECATSKPTRLSFYINSLRVPLEFVSQVSEKKATLNLTINEHHFKPRGDIRVQCSGSISGIYQISSRVATIRRMTEYAPIYSKAVQFSNFSISFLYILYLVIFRVINYLLFN